MPAAKMGWDLGGVGALALAIGIGTALALDTAGTGRSMSRLGTDAGVAGGAPPSDGPEIGVEHATSANVRNRARIRFSV